MKSYSLSEIAKVINKSRQWTWFLIKTKELEAYKIGNQYVITEEFLNNYFNKNKKDSK